MDDRLFFYSTLGFFAGFYFFYKGFVWMKLKRIIENTPTSKIRSIAMGFVEAYGKVISYDKILKSPFSNKDCFYYKYVIQEYRSSGKSSSWVTVSHGTDFTYFYLQDKTGNVLVDPKGAEMNIPLDYEFNSSIGKDPPIQIKKFLKSSNASFESFLGMNKRMKYQEYFIAPNDKLYILGTAGKNPFVKASAKNEELIMLQKGQNEKIFYISDSQERDILNQLKWKMLLGLFGGAALIIGCLTIIFKYLGFI